MHGADGRRGRLNQAEEEPVRGKPVTGGGGILADNGQLYRVAGIGAESDIAIIRGGVSLVGGILIKIRAQNNSVERKTEDSPAGIPLPLHLQVVGSRQDRGNVIGNIRPDVRGFQGEPFAAAAAAVGLDDCNRAVGGVGQGFSFVGETGDGRGGDVDGRDSGQINGRVHGAVRHAGRGGDRLEHGARRNRDGTGILRAVCGRRGAAVGCVINDGSGSAAGHGHRLGGSVNAVAGREIGRQDDGGGGGVGDILPQRGGISGNGVEDLVAGGVAETHVVRTGRTDV